MITVALAKGRLAELAVELFLKNGFHCEEILTKTRKLIFEDEEHGFRFILVKASDVPTYVEHGAADIGVVGSDTILEEGRNLYEVLDLGFGACRMCVCGYPDTDFSSMPRLRVGTKYPHIATDFFHLQKGQTIEIIKLSGSVELAPLTGLSDVIVDIVESGKTLYENGLTVLEEVCPLSARLIVNRVSMKLKKEQILDVIGRMRKSL